MSRADRLKRQLATTPGLLLAVTVGLVVLGLASGTVGLLTVAHRTTLVHDVGTDSGPLSVQAQNIYRLLSDADATAATAYLANGVEPVRLRQRYRDDLAQAGAALTVALRDADDRGAEKLKVLAVQVPIYAGLVETARSYNRQGLPLGAAYLREASGLMRQTILPAAQQLFGVASDRLDTAQSDAVAFPWTLLILGVLTLAGLAGAQLFLVRRTNRLVNVGLAIASIAALISLLWSTVALTTAAAQVGSGRREGSTQFQLLAQARVAALQARADEALALVARGDGAASERHYQLMLRQLIGTDGTSGLLGRARDRSSDAGDWRSIDDARAQARRWLAVHQRLRALDDGGRYTDAVALATDAGSGSPTAVFARLDTALSHGLRATGDRFDRRADRAGGILDATPAAIVLPGLLFLVGTVGGVQRRIGEYR